MDELIRLRLQILEDSGEITGQTAESVRDFIGILESRYSIIVTEENGAMLVTHLAVALNRIGQGETIQGIEPALLEEAGKTRFWDELPELLGHLEKRAGVLIPEEERGYLALHLAVMLEKVKGAENY